MRKILLTGFILIILLYGQDLYSQKIFREGYIVKKTGESLNGLVEFSMNQDIPSVCSFKRFDIARKVVYTPKEIVAFGYRNGNRYESKEQGNKSTFYEVIVTGKIILYRKGSKFYLDKDHAGLVELKNGTVTYPAGEGSKEFKNLPEFLNFITEGKTGTISNKFILKNEIVQLVTSFNKESGMSYYVFNRSLSEKQLTNQIIESGANKNKFGVLSGVNLYEVKLKYNPDFYGLNTEIFIPGNEKEMAPVYGLTYERVLLRKSDRLSIRLDLLYTSQTFYSFREITSTYGGKTIDDAFFNFSGIKIPVLLQYSITGRRFVPYVNAGIAYQVMFDKNYYHTAEVENLWHEITISEDHNMQINSGEFSCVGGLGIRTRLINSMNLNILGRVEYGTGLFVNAPSETMGTASKKSYIQNSIQVSLLVGITF